jgi:hypothetical protein
MIPNEAKRHFQDVITHKMFEMDRTLSAAFAAVQSDMHSSGRGVSGLARSKLTAEATHSLEARARYIYDELLRCLAAHQVDLDNDTEVEAATLLKDNIETQGQIILGQLFGLPTFTMPEVQTGVAQLRAQFDQEPPRISQYLTTELQMRAAASRPISSGDGTKLIINGPVGIIQTGYGATATVQQQLDTGTKQAIAAALTDLIALLDTPMNASLRNRDELRAFALEAKEEAEKPQGSMLKLGSQLRTIAETTKFIGSLGPAYQVIKPLLSFFNIHLP